jgi:hypothetical protein
MVAQITAGKAMMIIPAKIRIAQANTGMRHRLMPGARVRSTPTIISMAPAMAEISMKPIPSSQTSALMAAARERRRKRWVGRDRSGWRRGVSL